MWIPVLMFLLAVPAWAEDLGELSANPFNPDSTSNPFATDAPRLFAHLSGLSGFFDSPARFSGPVNKTNQIDQIHKIDQFRLSLRRRESLQPQQSHESLRPRPADRRKVIPPLGNSRHSRSSLLYSPL